MTDHGNEKSESVRVNKSDGITETLSVGGAKSSVSSKADGYQSIVKSSVDESVEIKTPVQLEKDQVDDFKSTSSFKESTTKAIIEVVKSNIVETEKKENGDSKESAIKNVQILLKTENPSSAIVENNDKSEKSSSTKNIENKSDLTKASDIEKQETSLQEKKPETVEADGIEKFGTTVDENKAELTKPNDIEKLETSIQNKKQELITSGFEKFETTVDENKPQPTKPSDIEKKEKNTEEKKPESAKTETSVQEKQTEMTKTSDAKKLETSFQEKKQEVVEADKIENLGTTVEEKKPGLTEAVDAVNLGSAVNEKTLDSTKAIETEEKKPELAKADEVEKFETTILEKKPESNRNDEVEKFETIVLEKKSEPNQTKDVEEKKSEPIKAENAEKLEAKVDEKKLEPIKVENAEKLETKIDEKKPEPIKAEDVPEKNQGLKLLDCPPVNSIKILSNFIQDSKIQSTIIKESTLNELSKKSAEPKKVLTAADTLNSLQQSFNQNLSTVLPSTKLENKLNFLNQELKKIESLPTVRITFDEANLEREGYRFKRQAIAFNKQTYIYQAKGMTTVPVVCKLTVLDHCSPRLKENLLKNSAKIIRYIGGSGSNEALHPVFVRVYEIFLVETKLYTFMDQVSSLSIYDIIKQRKKYGQGEGREWMRAVCDAVDFIHKRGIAHRSIKMENVLIEKAGGVPKLCGWSRSVFYWNPNKNLLLNQNKETKSFEFYHLPPEAFVEAYDPTKADTWSLGVLMIAIHVRRYAFNIKSKIDFQSQWKCFMLKHRMNHTIIDLLNRLFLNNISQRLTIGQMISDPYFNVSGQELGPTSHGNDKKVSSCDSGISQMKDSPSIFQDDQDHNLDNRRSGSNSTMMTANEFPIEEEATAAKAVEVKGKAPVLD